MTPPARLTDTEGLHAGVRRPAHGRDGRVGILHLGLGGFHRAHQAVYTDDALESAGGDWMIEGVSLRSAETARRLNPQNGLFTVIERGIEGDAARVIGALRRVIAAHSETEALLERMASPDIRIVSLTVTEKAYGLDPVTGGLSAAHPAIAADLAGEAWPESVVGLLVAALDRRRRAGMAPFTTLSCDNLAANGPTLARLCAEYAARRHPEAACWIEAEAAFPATMVDRIVPAPDAKTLADAARLTGREDQAAIATEPFRQWVIEDRFTLGRPQWEAGGALFVEDVAGYERMKLRMLNGAHSLIAWLGVVTGKRYVRDCIADRDIACLVRRHFREAAATLDPLPGIEFGAYASALLDRFANPAVDHQTRQIAIDGTQKLPQRLLAPAAEALAAGRNGAGFALGVAAWMRHSVGRDEDDARYGIDDPREAEIAKAVAGGTDFAERLFALPGLFPPALLADAAWSAEVRRLLRAMLDDGVMTTLRREVQSIPDRQR